MERLQSCTTHLLLLVLFNVDMSFELKCQQTIRVNYTTAIGECSGDTCFSQIKKDETIFGCLTGYKLKQGCTNESIDVRSCRCNGSDFCNKDLSGNDVVQEDEIECYKGPVKDGKVEGNITCMGQSCILVSFPAVGGSSSEIKAGCKDNSFRSVHYYLPQQGCASINHSGLGEFVSCRCSTNLCNAPSAFNFAKEGGKVKCLRNVEQQDEHKLVVGDPECNGQYCVLAIARDDSAPAPVQITRACMSFSNGAEIQPSIQKAYQQNTLDVYYCNEDNCNKDVDAAFESIMKNKWFRNQTMAKPK